MPHQPNEYPAPIANHYGRPTLRATTDGWVLALGTHACGESTVRVSEDFAAAWVHEFSGAVIPGDGE